MPSIPPYDEVDEAAARRAIALWRPYMGPEQLVREIAGARAQARREGGEAALAPFQALFSGEPGTPCRTTRRPWTIPPTECVEVPMKDLQATFDEAEATLK